MDLGIFVAPAADSYKVVKRAEELGYRRAWFYDTQLLNAELFVSMAAAAVQTSTIRLGTGVLIPGIASRPSPRAGSPASTSSRRDGSTSASPPASRRAGRWGSGR